MRYDVQTNETQLTDLPDEHGHFGPYGGIFVAETLMELAVAHTAANGAGVAGFLRARANLREAAALDDESGRIDHCTIQLTLARTEMSLGNHDEALLCLFEVERIGCGHDPEVVAAADALRRDIERGMTSSARELLPDLSLLAGLPEMVEELQLARYAPPGGEIRLYHPAGCREWPRCPCRACCRARSRTACPWYRGASGRSGPPGSRSSMC